MCGWYVIWVIKALVNGYTTGPTNRWFANSIYANHSARVVFIFVRAVEIGAIAVKPTRIQIGSAFALTNSGCVQIAALPKSKPAVSRSKRLNRIRAVS